MFITKECDYGVRLIRALSTQSKMTVQDISTLEHIPTKFAYKILKKLEKNNLVHSYRGAYGGYALSKPIDGITLYEIFTAIDENFQIMECMSSSHKCPKNPTKLPCQIHKELYRIQGILFQELKKKTIKEILDGLDSQK